jgi:hypothetical protein
MARRWLRAVLTRVATAVMGLGVGLFMLGVLGGVLVLRAVATGLVGEGNRLPPESPEPVRRNLAILGGLFVTAVVGWLLARLGDAFQQPEPVPPLLARLADEMLLLFGGLGLANGVLVWCGPWAPGYEVPEAYRRAGITAVGCGPVCLVLGGVLFRRSERHVQRTIDPLRERTVE